MGGDNNAVIGLELDRYIATIPKIISREIQLKEIDIMEYKCNFCGKTYTNPIEYATCVARCNEAEKKRQEEDRRKKIAEQEEARRKKEAEEAQTRLKEIDRIYTEYIKKGDECEALRSKLETLLKKEYGDYNFCDNGTIYKWLFPEKNPFDYFNNWIL